MRTGLRGRRVALIGGAGFIGHNLALKLVDRGAEVAVVDSLQVNNLLNFTASFDGAHKEFYLKVLHDRLHKLEDAGIPLHVQDARDYHALTEIMKEAAPDVVVHLAAVAHAGRANKNPFNTFDHSLRTLENALDWSRENIDRFIYFSSSMAYGDFQEPEVTEDHPLDPKGIYGALKVCGEKLVTAYEQVFDIPYTIIRPSALYGPRCVSQRVGQVFIENALTGETLVVDGDGSDRLDFTYIDDLTDGVCLAIERPEAENEIFNMTYGQARSIKELVGIVQTHFPNVGVEHRERDELTPERGTLRVDKAHKLLGYDPDHPLERGVEKYVSWYKEFLDEHGRDLLGAPNRA